MIVNYTEQGWEIITQRAHGLLAAALAAQWKKKYRGPRWLELLTAIAEHDDSRIELLQPDILTAAGAPLDFKMKGFDLRHCEETVLMARSKSTYIALLCSMHLGFVCPPDAPAQVQAFLKDQVSQREAWRRQLGITATQIRKDYSLLEWCDALSLLLCQHENQPEGRKVEISKGPDGKVHQLSQRGNELTVTPWPFEHTSFEVSYEYRVLNRLVFDQPAQFREIMLKTVPQTRIWTLKK
ncbi:DUF3891 domain-containing protein [Pedobacter yulinensis]|uniref:DUF3891 domain-containing protein n=1 Tax=Pedobacter yulinensis TaxID=2126353 RepID=A0A2T3HNC5_9SPHI|nr:DUF3891 family protein [Pedobacter yulinensis]PST83944.1 DUF3891 domain-containing protein [Pedobacter yulinensis]